MKFITIHQENNTYQIANTQMIQGVWKKIMGENPAHFKGDNLPVESVSWNDVQSFIEKLNKLQSKFTYRLPTEAEWEYCCRAGSSDGYCFGNDENELKDYAWFYDNSKNKTHPVGLKRANKFGLYDMHGNVWEWCADLWTPMGSHRAVRGGCWYNAAQNLRAGGRSGDVPGCRDYGLGFRLVRTHNSRSSHSLTIADERAQRALAVASEALEKIKKILGNET